MRTVMLGVMRTTVIIEDGLLREARHRAAARDTTLSEVLNEALRELLRIRPIANKAVKLPTFGNRKDRRRLDPREISKALQDDGA
jgi:hypothetical protein